MSEPTKEQRKAARKAVEREMRSRTYDRHAYDEDVFKEGVRDIADAALRAAFAVEGGGRPVSHPLNAHDSQVSDETRDLLWPGHDIAWECSTCHLVYASPARHAEFYPLCAKAAREGEA